MKRFVSILVSCAAVVSLLSGCAAKNSGEEVSVQSVAMITGVGSVGVVDSYAGKVVSGETAELKKDSEKTILDVYVEEGDMVSEGDVLFAYDTEAMQLDLDKLYLDKESYENTITAAQSEIEELESQQASASSSQQLSYTLQINSREADIREAEYNIALKEREIASMETDMENAEITAPISGRVMSVKDDDATTSTGDTTDVFITIMDVSSYRVQGEINELNRGSLTEGMAVLVRSRVDETQVWSGVIESIDWENPVSNSQNVYYQTDDMTTSSKYPFYVTLDSTDGLLLGQHVYIEPDYGQDVQSTALMLPAYYITGGADNAWVWAASAKGTLEKRSVTLGAYDADLDEYEILSGLEVTDYIAYPEDTLSEGMSVVYYDESSFGEGEGAYADGGYADEGVYTDEGSYDEGANTDGSEADGGTAVVSEPYEAASATEVS